MQEIKKKLIQWTRPKLTETLLNMNCKHDNIRSSYLIESIIWNNYLNENKNLAVIVADGIENEQPLNVIVANIFNWYAMFPDRANYSLISLMELCVKLTKEPLEINKDSTYVYYLQSQVSQIANIKLLKNQMKIGDSINVNLLQEICQHWNDDLSTMLESDDDELTVIENASDLIHSIILCYSATDNYGNKLINFSTIYRLLYAICMNVKWNVSSDEMYKAILMIKDIEVGK